MYKNISHFMRTKALISRTFDIWNFYSDMPSCIVYVTVIFYTEVLFLVYEIFIIMYSLYADD